MNLGEIIAVILAFNQDATTFYANLPQTQKGPQRALFQHSPLGITATE